MGRTLKYITEEGLLIRPSLVGGWWCSKWKSVSGDNRAACDLLTIGEGDTIKEAIADYKIKKDCEHKFTIKGYKNQCEICGQYNYRKK